MRELRMARKSKIQATATVQVQRTNEDDSNGLLVGMSPPFRALPHADWNRVEHVVVTLVDRVIVRIFRRKLDLTLWTPTARGLPRAGGSSHGVSVS
jgi:hypothetical protein